MAKESDPHPAPAETGNDAEQIIIMPNKSLHYMLSYITKCRQQGIDTGEACHPIVESISQAAEIAEASGLDGKLHGDFVRFLISYSGKSSNRVVRRGVANQLTVGSGHIHAGTAEDRHDVASSQEVGSHGHAKSFWVSRQIRKPPRNILYSVGSYGHAKSFRVSRQIRKPPRNILYSTQQRSRKRSHDQVLDIGEASERAAEITEDGILCSILSLLNIRDAVRTSLLSRRWKDLWTCIPNLVFDAHNMFEDYHIMLSMLGYYYSNHLDPNELQEKLWARRKKFIKSVHHFLRHHQCFGVNVFRVEFPLDSSNACDLDQWVDFAIESGAKELVLSLYESGGLGLQTLSTYGPYVFPFHLFTDGRGSSIEALGISYCTFSPHASFAGFSSLKKVSISHVFMTELDINIVLSVCSVMESLDIRYIKGLVNLKISHQSGRLKLFSVASCPYLMKIELNSLVLTWFEYIGDDVTLSLENESRVLKAHISMRNGSGAMKYSVTQLAGVFPQLENLFVYNWYPIKVDLAPHSYKFTHLKQLVLFVRSFPSACVLELGLFLSVAPFLEKFNVHLRPGLSHRDPVLPPKCIHSNLKQFEIGGFTCHVDEIALVAYVLMNTDSLESATIDRSVWHYSAASGWDKHFVPPFGPNEEIELQNAYQILSSVAQLAGAKLVIR